MDRVGVRELRQNLSVYLRRVKRGETLEVTERGETVAKLTPAREPQSVLERLVAEGKVQPATRRIEDLPPPVKLPPGAEPLSETLRKMREEERF
jgi:prevent-host-death family protein